MGATVDVVAVDGDVIGVPDGVEFDVAVWGMWLLVRDPVSTGCVPSSSVVWLVEFDAAVSGSRDRFFMSVFLGLARRPYLPVEFRSALECVSAIWVDCDVAEADVVGWVDFPARCKPSFNGCFPLLVADVVEWGDISARCTPLFPTSGCFPPLLETGGFTEVAVSVFVGAVVLFLSFIWWPLGPLASSGISFRA